MFKNVNKVIKGYIFWDITVNAAWGLIGPIFAIFLLQQVAHGDLALGARVAGFSTLCYWITKSILQIPIGQYLDKNHGEIDDFWFFVTGSIITAFVPIGFLFATTPWHIYLLQVFHSAGMAMVVPSSYAILIRHTDKGKEAYEGGLDSTLLGLGVGITGALGGIAAGYLGFTSLFLLVSLLNFVSVLCLLPLRHDMLVRMPRHVHKIPIESSKKTIK